MVDPIELITHDRAEARKQSDPNADMCFLALADEQGKPSLRTLVMREIADNRFRIFINKTSPKWRALSRNGAYELMLWYPTMQRQYRLQGSHELLSDEVIETNWLRRPGGSKYLDYLYEHVADQSTNIESRAKLVATIADLKTTYPVDDMSAPTNAIGIELIITDIERLDLSREDRIHDRRRFSLGGDGKWTEQILVP